MDNIPVPYEHQQVTTDFIVDNPKCMITSDPGTGKTRAVLDAIKERAPQTYYTQNRMITGEDYNISPLAVNQQLLKIKAVNRSSSGISRYFDLIDPTGKYSKTNLFSDDGAVYKELYNDSFRFSYSFLYVK